MTTRRHIPLRRTRSHGLGLLEILVGASLSLMVLASVYSFQLAQARSFATENTYNESQNVTRSALDLMARELRMASYDPSGLALATSLPPNCPGVKEGLTEAFTDKIHFLQDLNGDGVLTGAAENVTYDVSSTDLRRTDGIGTPVTLVSNVPAGGFQLRYFDGSNPPIEILPVGNPPQLTLAQLPCVSKVRMTVRANLTNPNPKITAPVASAAETEIAIRNRSLGNF